MMLPDLTANRDDILKRVTARKSQLKVVLKTKDDALLLPIWLEHYLGFLEPHEIIIADNGSTDPAVLAVYSSLPSEMVLFSYQADPARGHHNTIHDRQLHPDFHKALAASCEHVLMIDSDELLMLADGTTWRAERASLLALLARHRGRALPTVWLEAIAASLDTVYLGEDNSRIVSATAWGKPFVPSDFSHGGFRIHNVQFPRALFDTPDVVPVLLHIPNYSVENRLRANREKLVSRGVIPAGTSFSRIAAHDTSDSRDPTVVRLVKDTQRLLMLPPHAQTSGLPGNCLRFGTGGAIEISGTAGPEIYQTLSNRLHDVMGEAFALGARTLGPASAAAEDVESRLAQILRKPSAEAALYQAMLDEPDRSDSYGDPVWRKELIRLLLSQGRFDEARAHVPGPREPGRTGWYNILFARAHDQAGRPASALPHWHAFLKGSPGHAEAVQAIARIEAMMPQDPSR